MKYKYDFITIGGATEDITFFTDQAEIIKKKKDTDLIAFKYGTKIKIDNSYSTFGGGAANTAVNLSNLGLRVAIKAYLGDDVRGQGIVDNFVKKKVDTDLIEIVKREESGFSFLVVSIGSEHILFTSRGANNRLEIKRKDKDIFSSSKWLFVSSLGGDWKKILEKVFEIEGPKIAWNPGYDQLKNPAYMKKYLKQTEVFLLNKEEAIRFVSAHAKYKEKNKIYLNKPENLLKIMNEWGVKISVVTDGANGTHVYDGDKFYFRVGNKVAKIQDTTGVGDCFGSTFVAALEITDFDIDKSLKIASKNVASVLGEIGAQNGLLRRRELL